MHPVEVKGIEDILKRRPRRTTPREQELLRRRPKDIAPNPPSPPPMPAQPNLPVLEAEKPFQQRLGTFKVRFIWTLILLATFISLLAAGHFYASLLVLLVTTLVYREVIALKRNAQKDKKLPLFFSLRWYWFFLTIYGTSYSWLLPLADSLGIERSAWLEIAVTHHLIITYLAAFLGVILFVASLRRFSLRYQFSQFGILILTCLLVVGQSVFQIANIYDGFIWFILSSTTVIVNDCSAYIFGMLFGKTRLFKLSPKKTVEGFLGASVVTLLWAVALAQFLAQYSVLTCPQSVISFRPFAMWSELSCDTSGVFLPATYRLPQALATLYGSNTFVCRPVLIHALVLGLFGAFFAPFGGFFASALKRALRIKDFGASIPGHGGITDRFDCQILMGSFTFFYLKTFVFRNLRRPSLQYIIKLIGYLSLEEKQSLRRMLEEAAVRWGDAHSTASETFRLAATVANSTISND